jgi:hypothetical protein
MDMFGDVVRKEKFCVGVMLLFSISHKNLVISNMNEVSNFEHLAQFIQIRWQSNLRFFVPIYVSIDRCFRRRFKLVVSSNLLQTSNELRME